MNLDYTTHGLRNIQRYWKRISGKLSACLHLGFWICNFIWLYEEVLYYKLKLLIIQAVESSGADCNINCVDTCALVCPATLLLLLVVKSICGVCVCVTWTQRTLVFLHWQSAAAADRHYRCTTRLFQSNLFLPLFLLLLGRQKGPAIKAKNQWQYRTIEARTQKLVAHMKQ